MKRILMMLMCLVLLCGCGGKTEEVPAAGDTAVPMIADYAVDETEIDYAYFPADTEDCVYILFTAKDNLTRLQLCELELTETGYSIGTLLYTEEAMGIGQTMVAPLAFYGDMTAYGVSFADSNGAYRNYAVTVSGEDGALLFQEFVP